MFTSILDAEVKKRAATEILRVLKKDGLLIWYDFRYSNPANPAVKGINKKEICSLFTGCTFDFNLVTLFPWLTRRLAFYSLKLCELIKKVPFLRTHWLVAIKKK
jgi:hypothetical protein